MNDMSITRPGFDSLLTEPSSPPSAPGKIAAEFAAESRPRELGSYGRAPESAYTGNVGPSRDDIQAFTAALAGESMPGDSAGMLPDAKAPVQPAAAQMTAAQPAPAQPAPVQIPAAQPAPVQIPAAQPAPVQIPAAQLAPAQPAAVQIPAAQPAPAQPGLAQPAPAQLAAAQPAPAQPAPAQPATAQPAPAKAPPARAEVPPSAAAATLGKARPHSPNAESDSEMPALSAAPSAVQTPALPVAGAENLLAQQSQIVANPAAAASSQAPVRDPLSAEHIVQYVTRTLARRDLEALSAGREVVLRLDDRLLPETTLTFQPLTDDLPGSNSAQPPQVLISLRTESPEVNAFLTAHADDLVEAMSREAPGIRWELNDEFYRAPATSVAGERSAGLTDQYSDSQALNEPGSRGDRSSGQDQPRDNPQGQPETFDEDTLAYRTPRAASAPEGLQGQGPVNFETLVDG